ncbi:GNAT family N-acetyltransferase [Actinomadura logoneensis]|uniref:GNAT family N-acetyltransferase n=1 Tax=Actinomadura logoneensis TaxID=2293572 RepID=A0A372J9B8_9ACTN|nr:GNAT family N-acetyltransferase [Actinomadura logoneensis]RFU36577.1 GNAT family N-acetyltransferase [Actinomadura logoneensis]
MPDVLRLDLDDPAVLAELWEIQRAAYTVEAELIGFHGIPALHESPADLRECGEDFLGAKDEGKLLGAISWTVLDDGTVDICRLVVHPSAHRRGLATALLDALEAETPTARTLVSTATANHPALTLYQARGFKPVAVQTVTGDLNITHLERHT